MKSVLRYRLGKGDERVTFEVLNITWPHLAEAWHQNTQHNDTRDNDTQHYGLFATDSINDTQQNNTAVMLSVAFHLLLS
jgi:hypothetical protein